MRLLCFGFRFEDGEVLGDQSECHDACGKDADGDGDFRQGWEVVHIAHEGRKIEQRVRVLDREPTDIEAIENHTEKHDDRARKQTIGASAILFDREPDDGSDHTDENLCPEKHAHDAAGEKQTELTSYSKLTKFEQGINAECNR